MTHSLPESETIRIPVWIYSQDGSLESAHILLYAKAFGDHKPVSSVQLQVDVPGEPEPQWINHLEAWTRGYPMHDPQWALVRNLKGVS